MNKQKLLSLGILLFMAIILPVVMILTGQIQLISKKAAGEGTIKGYLDPATGTKNKGDTIPVTIKLKNTSTTDQHAKVVSAFIRFDPAVVTLSGVGASDNPCNSTNFSKKAHVEVNTSGLLEISCYVDPTLTVNDVTFPSAGTEIAFASFSVAIKSTATASQAVLAFAGLTIPKMADPLINLAGDKVGATFTIQGNVATGPGIDFKVKFRDVTNRPAACYQNQTMNFKVKLVKAGSTTQNLTATTTVNDQNIDSTGTWTIHATGFNKVAGNYDIYIKGPKQLQKKFPKKALTSADSQTVDLVALGAKYFLEGGDLPIGTNGAQDGVVSAVDANSLVNCFADPESAACVAKADLNFDCIITSGDVNLMNNTIFTRWEDDEQL